jgi:hypothetical protein
MLFYLGMQIILISCNEASLRILIVDLLLLNFFSKESLLTQLSVSIIIFFFQEIIVMFDL